MHGNLPWIEGPRTPRPVLPRVWAPSPRRPLECVILAPFRRLPVHWTGVRHVLHFPGACPNCPQWPTFEEHGYAAALVRWATAAEAEVQGWDHGVVQLTQGPLTKVVYRSSDPWIYTLRRNGGAASMVSTERRECQRALWLQGKPFEVAPVLERLYGCAWRDGAGRGAKLLENRTGKAGAP
jgi:hypothetical protein